MGSNTSRPARAVKTRRREAGDASAVDQTGAAGEGDEARERLEVQRVLDGIRRIVQSLRHSSREAERRAGLTAAQLFVLGKLGETGCSSLNELADRTFTHQSTVSTVVSKLVDQRLIARQAAPEDRRRLTLSLTARGRRVLAAAPDAAQDALIAVVSALPSASRRQVGQALGQIAGALADPRERTRMFFDDHPDDDAGHRADDGPGHRPGHRPDGPADARRAERALRESPSRSTSHAAAAPSVLPSGTRAAASQPATSQTAASQGVPPPPSRSPSRRAPRATRRSSP